MFDWGSYDTKVGTMIAAGEPADIVFTCGWALPFRSNAQKGAFLQLDDLMAKYGTHIAPILGQSYLEGGRLDGKQYALPINKDRAHSQGIQFNKNMVQKYKFNLSKVKKLEDIEPMLKVIYEKEKGNIVTIVSAGTNAGSGPLTPLDFDYLSGDSNVPLGLLSNNNPSNIKIVNFFETKEAIATLKLTRKWYELGYIRKDAPTMKTDPSIQEGKSFVSFAQLKPNGDKEASTLKRPLIQVELTKPVSANGDLNNSMVAISRTSENPERAMMLLDLMYTDKKLLNMVTLGIEGKHYTKVDANTYKQTTTPFWTTGGVQWMFGNQFLDYLKTTEPKDKWFTLRKFNIAATPLRSVGFTFDSSSLQTEMAAAINVYKEYVPVIVTGSVDPTEYLPKFIEALNKAGINKIKTEMQKQYDAFLKTKKK